MTTAAVSANICTVGGKQIVSLQLIEQAGVGFDQVVIQDLTADYARALNAQALSGSGTGG